MRNGIMGVVIPVVPFLVSHPSPEGPHKYVDMF